MFSQTITILYVNHMQESAGFYRRLLEREPIKSSPTFVMFAIREGVLLGLWSHQTLQPASTAAAGASELAFPVTSDDCVRQLHEIWKSNAITMPVQAEFGYNFLMQDPDGHRLRIFHAPQASA